LVKRAQAGSVVQVINGGGNRLEDNLARWFIGRVVGARLAEVILGRFGFLGLALAGNRRGFNGLLQIEGSVGSSVEVND